MNLNLNKTTGDKPVLILHSIHYKAQRFRISSGQSIEPKHWDKEKQQIKRTRKNFEEYNAILRDQCNELERAILNNERTKRPVIKETIIPQLSWISNNISNEFSILNLFLQFIQQHGADRSQRTIKGYKSTYKYLQDYEKSVERKLNFIDFNDDFYKRFRAFLNMYDNAFGFYIKNLKTFLNWATDKAFNEFVFYKKWKITNEDSKAHFFLKYDEILMLANYQFNERLQKVCDLFLIACYCGLRYSDLISLKPIHVQDGMISKTAMKTAEPVNVPVIPELQQLFDKYWKHSKELPFITNQKGNEYLKELSKAAGLNRNFNYIQKQNKKIIEQTYEAWEMMSWHVARHSFITNCIQLGVPAEVVRRVVGHASFKTLKKYIQNDDEFNKKEIMKLSNYQNKLNNYD